MPGRASNEHRHALIAASAGAGLAVAFNAPAGGILFFAEEMRDDIAKLCRQHLAAEGVRR